MGENLSPYYIGIDPGKGGGIAVLSADGRVLMAVKMPETERDILDALKGHPWRSDGAPAVAMLEFVRSSPQMGVASSFQFGRGYGGLRMALVATGIPFDEVIPRKWQAAMQCLSGCDKSVTRRRAQELFPSVKATHAISDALLIAEYGRRFHLGLLRAQA